MSTIERLVVCCTSARARAQISIWPWNSSWLQDTDPLGEYLQHVQPLEQHIYLPGIAIVGGSLWSHTACYLFHVMGWVEIEGQFESLCTTLPEVAKSCYELVSCMVKKRLWTVEIQVHERCGRRYRCMKAVEGKAGAWKLWKARQVHEGCRRRGRCMKDVEGKAGAWRL